MIKYRRKCGEPLVKFFYLFKEYLEKRKLWEIFIYLFFGGLTTVVNFIAYFICVDLLQINYLIANAVAWLASVIFAFVTNKRWVFHSSVSSKIELLIEFCKFIFYRVVSFGLDMSAMYVMISILSINDFWAKLVTQILVVVANYFFSKFFIFQKKK